MPAGASCVRSVWRDGVEQANGRLWLAEVPPTSVWRERVTLLAAAGLSGPWGAVGRHWAGVPAGPGPQWDGADTSCPVCLDDFDGLLPLPSPQGRRVGAFGCGHAICNACEVALRGRPNDRCPLCRAARV